MLLNARRMYNELGGEKILLAIEDVTGQPGGEPLHGKRTRMNEAGTGFGERLSRAAQLWWQRVGSFKMLLMPSPEGVHQYNKLTSEGKREVALIHVTC